MTVLRNSQLSNVRRSSITASTLYAVINVPVFFIIGSGLHVGFNVRLPDDTVITTTRNKRHRGGGDLIPVDGLWVTSIPVGTGCYNIFFQKCRQTIQTSLTFIVTAFLNQRYFKPFHSLCNIELNILYSLKH